MCEKDIEFSKKHKRKINRINREIIGAKKAIYPEVDNLFEKFRSKTVLMWNIVKSKLKDK